MTQMQFPPDYPELLAEMAQQLHGLFMSLGIPEAQSEFAAREAAEVVRLNWGGQQLYVGKGVAYEATQRDWEIWRKYRGDNAHALAQEHELTYRMVMYIVKRMREVERSKRQLSLLDPQPRT